MLKQKLIEPRHLTIQKLMDDRLKYKIKRSLGKLIVTYSYSKGKVPTRKGATSMKHIINLSSKITF